MAQSKVILIWMIIALVASTAANAGGKNHADHYRRQVEQPAPAPIIEAVPRRLPPVFDEEGNVETDLGTQRLLDFPTTNTAYTYGDKFRVMLQLEMMRANAGHLDFNVGEQFLGASAGVTLGETGLGNVSALAGYGYDLDDSKFDAFFGLSHRSTLLGLSQLKAFAGWDVVLGRIRKGAAWGLYEKNDYHLDLVGTSKLLGRRNFLGLFLGKDWFRGKGGAKKRAMEANLGVFAGYDFNEVRASGKEGDWGAGIGGTLRF